MEHQKESMESIVKRAPEGATHYQYPDEDGFDEAFLKVEEGVIVELAWVPQHIGSTPLSTDLWEDFRYYEEGDVNLDRVIKLCNNTHSKWMPDTGETVLFKRTDSIDYAYDSTERMEVVAIVGDKVWLKNEVRDLVANLGDISPLKKEKSLREKLVEIISCSGQQTYVDASHAADRLIEAGIKLEEL